MATQSTFARVLTFVTELVVLCMLMTFIKLLLLFAPAKLVLSIAKISHKKFNFAKDDPVGPMEALELFPTVEGFKMRLSMAWTRFRNTTLSQGEDVPNLQLVLLLKESMTSRVRLRDFMKSGRPLVLAFGSCTLPPFMSKLESFNKLVQQRQQNVDFLIIYIKDIHPADGWLFPSNRFSVNQARCIEERVMAAKLVAGIAKYCPVALDDMDNKAMALFDAMPERLYVVQDGRVVFQGRRGPVENDLKDMIKFLDNTATRKRQ